MTQPSEGPAAPRGPPCSRPPGRETWIRCQRCDRPICPDCMRDAAVGFQCPTCVAEGRKSVRQARTVAGGRIPVDVGRISLALIGINVAVYLAQMATQHREPSVYQLGAMQGYSVATGEYWRLLTAAFLHG